MTDWLVLFLSTAASEPFAAVIVEATSATTALIAAEDLPLGVDLHCPVKVRELPPGVVTEEMRDRLLTGEELREITAMTERMQREHRP